jgi:hypothetical protein
MFLVACRQDSQIFAGVHVARTTKLSLKAQRDLRQKSVLPRMDTEMRTQTKAELLTKLRRHYARAGQGADLSADGEQELKQTLQARP